MKKILSVMLTLALVFAMSAVALAEGQTINSGTTSSQSANVQLMVKATAAEQHFGGTLDTEAINDNTRRIWNVTISGTELKWDVTATHNYTDAKYTLVWNPETHKYTKVAEAGTAHDEIVYTLAAGESETKGFTIANNSNFTVTQSVSLGNDSAASALVSDVSDRFSISNEYLSLISGNSTTVNVTLNPNYLTGITADGTYYNVGTATVSLTGGEIYENAGQYAAQ